jgi:hypothetical protein
MGKAHLKLVAPTTVKRTVAPRRPPNRDLRTREHLTEAEVERLMDAAKGNRYGNRDATMVLVAYRHGLRASDAAAIWSRCAGTAANRSIMPRQQVIAPADCVVCLCRPIPEMNLTMAGVAAC